jgi:hypothetical protein
MISHAATIVAALCTSVASGTVTVAFAESQPPCRDITPDGFSKMADTFTCFLRVDDQVILDGRSWGMISGNTKYWSMRVADVYVRTDLPDRPYHARLFSLSATFGSVTAQWKASTLAMVAPRAGLTPGSKCASVSRIWSATRKARRHTGFLAW